MQTIRIFISSPGDVAEERERAKQVIESLKRRYAGRLNLKSVLWEELPLQADMSFQQGIDQVLSGEHGIDIAVFILWSRLGSPLGALIRKPDGSTYRSGTEREFDLMLRAREHSGGDRPVFLVYTRRDESSFEERLRGKPTSEKEDLIQQKKLVERFIAEEFHDTGSGHNMRAYHSFDRPQTFSQRLRAHLVELLDGLAGGDLAEAVWDIETQGPPFMGLEAFGEKQALVFCGRDAEILEARRLLTSQAREGCAFLLITGASGSGKSSLARAGLLPAIAEHELDETVAEWRTLAVTPSELGADPLSGLVTRLATPGLLPELRAEGSTLADTVDLLARDPNSAANLLFKRAVAEASAKRRGGVRLLLLIDQLEELFTKEHQENFLAAVEAFARSGVCWVVATVRGDFLGEVQKSPVLARLISGQGLLPVLPPDADDLRHMIEEPARLAGLHFEERDGQRLSDRILADAARHSDLLPLVEYVLRELFDQRGTNGGLTWQAYESLGGVEGALAGRANTVLATLPPAVQAALPAVLKRLVTLSEGSGGDEGAERLVRQRVGRDAFPDGTPARQLVDAFVKERLFTAGGGNDAAATVTLAHEALLRAWPAAAAWADENRELLRVRARVAARMLESARIAEGDPLVEAARFALAKDPEAFSGEQAAFVRHSHEAAEASRLRRESLRRKVMAGLAGLTMVAILGAIEAFRQRGQTQRERDLKQAQYDRAENEKRRAIDAAVIASERLSDSYLETGLNCLENENIRQGIAYLCASLRAYPGNRVAAARLAFEMQQRDWLLPKAVFRLPADLSASSPELEVERVNARFIENGAAIELTNMDDQGHVTSSFRIGREGSEWTKEPQQMVRHTTDLDASPDRKDGETISESHDRVSRGQWAVEIDITEVDWACQPLQLRNLQTDAEIVPEKSEYGHDKLAGLPVFDPLHPVVWIHANFAFVDQIPSERNEYWLLGIELPTGRRILEQWLRGFSGKEDGIRPKISNDGRRLIARYAVPNRHGEELDILSIQRADDGEWTATKMSNTIAVPGALHDLSKDGDELLVVTSTMAAIYAPSAKPSFMHDGLSVQDQDAKKEDQKLEVVSPDGALRAMASENGTIRIFSVESGREVARFESEVRFAEGGRRIINIYFTADSQWLVVQGCSIGGDYPDVEIYDANSGRMIFPRFGNNGNGQVAWDAILSQFPPNDLPDDRMVKLTNGDVFRLLPPKEPTPEWFLEMAEEVAGAYVSETGIYMTVGTEGARLPRRPADILSKRRDANSQCEWSKLAMRRFENK